MLIRNKIDYINPPQLLLLFIFLTSSFDLFLNINLFGFTLRIALLLILAFSFLSIIHFFIRNQLILNFVGYKFYFFWLIFLSLFIYNTTIITRNVAYMVWLFIYTIFIISLGFFKPNETAFLGLIKKYILSFRILALFGIAQSVLSLLGFDFYIKDWIGANKFPRVSGFSYEPSYFATYLMIGWSICLFILRSNDKSLIKSFGARLSFTTITIAIILTTSRMCIFLMVILLLFPYLQKLTQSLLKLKISIYSITILTISVLGITGLIIFQWDKIIFLFAGLGIGGASAHSSAGRIREFGDTIEIFLQSPIIGYSIGGIPSAIALSKGSIITAQEQTKSFEGMNVFAEVLAASGLFGFICFVLFLIYLFKTRKDLLKFNSDNLSNLSLIHNSLLFALVVEFILLCMNQNILRVYVWVHIALINYSYFSIQNLQNISRLQSSD